MEYRKKLALAAIAGVFAIAIGGLVVWSAIAQGKYSTNSKTMVQSVANSSNNSATQTANNSEPQNAKTMINLVSSPSALPFVQRWVAQYNLEQNRGLVNVIYTAEADSADAQDYANLTRYLKSNSADVAIIGNAQWDNLSADKNSVFVPVSAEGIAIVYNIPSFPDVPSGLKLAPATLQRILTGNITYWDDQSIKLQNSDLNLPHQKIVVVHLFPYPIP